jgi:beta-glucosidase
MSVPASQAAVDANASDVPGYLEAFDYSYKNAVNDTYIFGFGKSSF